MAYDIKELKARVKPEFHKNFKRYYPVESLREMGFKRSVCVKCGRGFWASVDRNFCDEPACSSGYRFIGEKLTKKSFTYKGAWDEYVKVFSKWGYIPIKRYPVVCRWYDELYFVNAGVNDFQPYVVAGEVPPPADAVLEPQFCLRFPDIDSVGVTGRHYTGFIMVGQHTFNTPKKYVYFKDEGILQMHEFLTKGLGVKSEEIFYHEDVWAGGGNFGPSMEFFARGLELGNQVYMQYEVTPSGGSRELKTKVIDMGAGLERWSWFSQAVPMSYDTVFPKVMEFLYKKTGIKPDRRLWAKFARYAGLLSIDEIDDVDGTWKQVAGEVGVDLDELKKEAYRMRALYAIGDHTRTLLVGIHDGALPSNVGGGYNLRNILRRCWSLMDEFGFSFDLTKVFEKHIKEFGRWYTELREVGSLWDILDVEHERFEEGKKKAKAVVERMIAEKEDFTAEKLAELYDSQGIHPNIIREFKKDLHVPDNFYCIVSERHERSKVVEEKERKVVSEGLPETKTLYYDDANKTEFEAEVVAVIDDYVVLNQTLFYPEGGGQEADAGTLNNVKVVDVQKEGKVILHKIEDASNFRKGLKVSGRVDAERRRQLMQHHTATHIINAAANKVLGPHIWQAGAHKGLDIARLDVTHYKAVSQDELSRIEEAANKIVSKKIPVKKMVLGRDEAERRYGFRIYQGGAVPGTELRIVEILGVDAEACGGTHLDNTSGVGRIKIVKATRIQDGVVRIEFKAGKAAHKESSREEKIFSEALSSLPAEVEDDSFDVAVLQEACSILGVQQEKLSQTIKRFVSEWEDTEEPIELSNTSNLAKAVESLFVGWKKAKKAKEKEASYSAESIGQEIGEAFSKESIVKKMVENLSIPALMKTATKVIKKEGRVLIIVNKVGEKANVVVASSNPKVDAGKLAAELSVKLGGGGRGDAKLGVGGGKSDKVKEILDKLKL